MAKVRRYIFSFLLLLVILLVSACSESPAISLNPSTSPPNTSPPVYSSASPVPSQTNPAPSYSYKVIRSYPHDSGAFTQGLIYDNGVLYEGTGRYRQSSLRKVDLETGQVLQIHSLPAEYFGEGIAIQGDQIFQLTWKNQTGFVYDKESFALVRNFSYATEGWGLTSDGKRLIMSDGTSILRFRDPETLQETGSIEVKDKGSPVTYLNELEYVRGQIYANIWQSNKIAVINPESGSVTAWIDLTGIIKAEDCKDPIDVLNGIAYDAQGDRLWVTGKLWPLLFEIEVD